MNTAATWNDEGNFIWKCVWIYFDTFNTLKFSHHDNAQVDRQMVSPELGLLETRINLDYFLHMFYFLQANTSISIQIVLLKVAKNNNNAVYKTCLIFQIKNLWAKQNLQS